MLILRGRRIPCRFFNFVVHVLVFGHSTLGRPNCQFDQHGRYQVLSKLVGKCEHCNNIVNENDEVATTRTSFPVHHQLSSARNECSGIGERLSTTCPSKASHCSVKHEAMSSPVNCATPYQSPSERHALCCSRERRTSAALETACSLRATLLS